jgi:DNA-binding NtrC family response regulator
MTFLDRFSINFWKKKQHTGAQEVVPALESACPTIAPPEKIFRVLVFDDKPAVLEALKILLHSEGFQVDAIRSPHLVLQSLAIREYHTLLLDLNYGQENTSCQEGLELLESIRAIDRQLPVVAMSAWDSIDLAVEAVRRGARDFLQKPWDDRLLVTTVRNHAELCEALRWGQRLEAENKLFRQQGRPPFIAAAPAMRSVVDSISQIGPSDANVFITGEHGTGKEVVAQMIHAASRRMDKPFIVVNTGGLADGTFESELFGHVKGAFTDARMDRIGRFELADTGTLFLDEIANVSLGHQAKLLRILESRELQRIGSSRTRQVDVRVLSATNADLRSACEAGNFREDLLFRLNTVELHIPPLRDRREDISALASHFLCRFAAAYHKEINSFSQDAIQMLTEHSWPGNIRELEHTIERAIILCRENTIQAHHLVPLGPDRPLTPDLSEMSLEAVESLLISKALARFGSNASRAADALGRSRGSFYRRMEKYGLYAHDHTSKEKR